MSTVTVTRYAEASIVGWKPTGDLTPQQWAAEGQHLVRVGRAWQWWLGDWATYGQQFGSMYDEAMNQTGLEYGTLANCVYVANAIDPSRRREELSWSHHYEVASLPPEEQSTWLALAVDRKLTRNQLREAIAASKREDPPAEQAGPLAGDEDPPEEVVDTPPRIVDVIPPLQTMTIPPAGKATTLTRETIHGTVTVTIETVNES